MSGVQRLNLPLQLLSLLYLALCRDKYFRGAYAYIAGMQLPIFLAIAFLAFIPSPSPVQAQSLRVGAAGSAPFVMEDDTELKGISIDVWKQIANTKNLQYQLIPQQSIRQTINAVASGELDLAIGPISITSERLERVAFTQPYFQAEIGLLIPRQRPTLWNRFKPLFAIALVSWGSVLIVGLFLVGNLLWLLERNTNTEHFPKQYLRGVGNGMWFAIVTLTTVGYGDKIPITFAGRTIAGLWMLFTMITASSFTAGLTTALTLSLSNQETERFHRPEDLRDASIAVVSGTTGEEWANRYGAQLNQTDKLKDAIELLQSGQVEGVVFDTPALKYYLHRYPDVPLRVADFALATENYGFVVPLKSPLLQKLNVGLLKMQENGKLKKINDSWLE